jgi:hypothetical protein
MAHFGRKFRSNRNMRHDTAHDMVERRCAVQCGFTAGGRTFCTV